MSYYYLGFLLALAFGVYASFLFLKASSIFAQYRDSVKSRTQGKEIIASWKFLMPLKENPVESTKMKQRRLLHATYVKRYYITMFMIIVLLLISAFSAKY